MESESNYIYFKWEKPNSGSGNVCKAVVMESVDGLEIKDNVFENVEEQVVAKNCENIKKV